MNKLNEIIGGKGKRKNILVTGGIAIIVIVIALLVGLTTAQMLQVDKYYILTEDLAAKQPITTSIVSEVQAAKGSAPANALSYDEIQQGGLFSRYALQQGDVIASSNAGPANDTSLGIPDDWAVTTFNVSSDDAVGGSIIRGDYIDVLSVAEGNTKYVFNNVLVLEAFTSSQEVTEDDVTRIGETIQYTVGMPSEDVAVLHAAVASSDLIKVVKAPMNANYKSRDTIGLGGKFEFNEDSKNIDLIEKSDPKFTPVIRDENGRPVNRANCEEGLIEPKDMCQGIAEEVETKNDTSKESGSNVSDGSNISDNKVEKDVEIVIED